jgi:signal peptide peptidase SppA
MGAWAILPAYLQSAVGWIRSGVLRPIAALPGDEGGAPPLTYALTPDGVAILPLTGHLMKSRSKYGGTSTVDARRALRAAVGDPKVGAILLRVDSPGGHVSGTPELADDVAAANAVKPVHAYIEDVGASAAYWVASQAGRVSASKYASAIGSLGVVAVLEDTSAAMDAAGVKVHVVSTGPRKGAGVAGLPVTEDDLAEVRTMVDSANGHFVAAVRAGREMDAKAADAVWTGEVWDAKGAKERGLIDAVETYEAAVERLAGPLRSKAMKARSAGR